MNEGGSGPALEPGATFAGYRIERRLGRGGMGVVYEATEEGLNRRVALKLITPEAAAEEVFRQRFAHESRIAASVEHPNVVPIYAAGEEHGVPWIAMRYVSGSDLGQRIAASGRLSPEDAVRIVAQAAGGLDAIHAAGLVHRDVKPANVLLTGREGAEHAYLTDFGVARNVATPSGLTKTGLFVGTLDYVAPEQIRGDRVDARVDVYALGCMLFKTLTGEVPFPRDDDVPRLYAHLNDEPPAPSRKTPGLPAAIDQVIARAMAKDPDERFPSAGDLGRAAEAAVRGADVIAPERVVATGEAAATLPLRDEEPGGETTVPAPADGETTAPAPAGGETSVPAPPAGETTAPAPPSGAATVPVPPTAPGRTTRGRRPRAGAIALAAAVVALAGVVFIALTGGDSGEEADGTGGSGAAAIATTTGENPAGNEAPPALTLSELVRRADQICEDSQEEFVVARAEFPFGETDISQAAPFAERLVEISSRQVRRLEALPPPEEVAGLYETYLDLRRDVNRFDEQALAAAQRGDLAEFQSWRQANTDAGPERTAIAREIGFQVCSANPNPRG
jgi:hypothetical protein